jgi:hypothetical protein
MIFIKERTKHFSLFLLVLGIFLLAGPLSAWGHNETIEDPFEFLDLLQQETPHDDTGLELWESKGSLTLTVTNSTDVAWGDFHFGISSGDAIFDPNETPTWDHGSGLYWGLSAGNTVLDLTFYLNPVAINDSVTFTVYTDNTSSGGLFGVCFYPTPVPIPSAVWLLGSALIGLIGFRRKCRD